MAQYPKTQPNKATTAEEPVCVSGKTISAAVTVAALHAAAPTDAPILGFSIPGENDDEDGTSREAIMWGDSVSQPNYVPVGVALDGNNCPVRDPTKVYVRKPSGAADVTDVAVNIFKGNNGPLEV